MKLIVGVLATMLLVGCNAPEPTPEPEPSRSYTLRWEENGVKVEIGQFETKALCELQMNKLQGGAKIEMRCEAE